MGSRRRGLFRCWRIPRLSLKGGLMSMHTDGAQIPELARAPIQQTLEAILRPIAYYRRCFRRHPGVVRVRMSPTLPPQQVLINDPMVIKDLINEDQRGDQRAGESQWSAVADAWPAVNHSAGASPASAASQAAHAAFPRRTAQGVRQSDHIPGDGGDGRSSAWGCLRRPHTDAADHHAGDSHRRVRLP